ncbi:MAG: FMN-binding protein [Clostridia bacterium]|nr:FMN-binding protein [Clostridia bacterium]
MNKKLFLIPLIILMCLLIISGCTNNTETSTNGEKTAAETSTGKYIDGVYEGKSELTAELYYGKAKITIENGSIKDIDFKIYDQGTFKKFLTGDKIKGVEEMLLDETYSKEVYANIQVYQEQCTNEFAGIKKYKEKLISEQNIDKVDVISGATWSNQLFKETVENTLQKAVKK